MPTNSSVIARPASSKIPVAVGRMSVRVCRRHIHDRRFSQPYGHPSIRSDRSPPHLSSDRRSLSRLLISRHRIPRPVVTTSPGSDPWIDESTGGLYPHTRSVIPLLGVNFPSVSARPNSLRFGLLRILRSSDSILCILFFTWRHATLDWVSTRGRAVAVLGTHAADPGARHRRLSYVRPYGFLPRRIARYRNRSTQGPRGKR